LRHSFTVIIPINHPASLSHPFGLLSKNLPILGAIAALWFLSNGLRRDGP
jgi:hypothetical protein